MDRIKIKGISCQAHIGVTEQERSRPQRVVVDLCLELDLEKAGTSDDLDATIDYVEVVQRVETLVAEQRFQLLESLASNLCRFLLLQYEIEAVQVITRKFPLLLRNEAESVEVQMRRERGTPADPTPS